MAKLLAFEAPEWIRYISIHLNEKVSNTEAVCEAMDSLANWVCCTV